MTIHLDDCFGDDGFGGNSNLIRSRVWSCSAFFSGVRYLARTRSRAAFCSGVRFSGGFAMFLDLGGFVHFIGCDGNQNSKPVFDIKFKHDDDELSRKCPSESDTLAGGSTHTDTGPFIVKNRFNLIRNQTMFRNMFNITALFIVPKYEVKWNHEPRPVERLEPRYIYPYS